MKKILIPLFAVMLTCIFSVQGFCAQNSAAHASDKSLILYYSLSGNTKRVADLLHDLVGGDIAEIKTVRPYPDDFHAVVEQAREERRTNFLPPLLPLDLNWQDYDTIYLGFPIWGNTIPQPMATFLSQNNLAGKTIIPFCTHDGYGVGRSFQVVEEYCPAAAIRSGFDMVGADARNAQKLLSEWLNALGVNVSAFSPGSAETAITVTIGEIVLTGMLNNSPTAHQFRNMLPVTISMGQYGGREYYGGIPNEIATHEEGRLYFDDGDITYCPQNNTIAIFYAQTDRPHLTMKVIPIGKITSDLSVFQSMNSSVNTLFNLYK